MRFFVLLMMMVLPFTAVAQENAPILKIAVIDVLALQNDSKAAKNIKDQVEALRKSYQKDFKDKESALQKAEKALVDKKDSLDKEEFAKQVKAFQEDVLKANQDLQKKQLELDKAVAEALNKLRDEIIKITGEISEREQYTIVLPRQGVFYFEKSMNITDEVMKELNKSVTKIRINAK